jgi:transketolase
MSRLSAHLLCFGRIVTDASLPAEDRIDALTAHAKQIRRNVVRMASGKGEGYVGQGLDVADILSVLFLAEMRYDPVEHGPDVDRLIFSAGHYSIGLWAALAEAGHLEGYDLETYGADGTTLIMSTHEGHPPLIELTGGSLAHGLGVAAGLAIGYRIKGWPARIFNFMTDGEVQEGSTWESAMFAASERLDHLVAVIDVNRTQADGDLVLEIEPLVEKWRSFGWSAEACDGNDIRSLLGAFDAVRGIEGRPKAIVCRTTLGKGVPLIERRERNHFVRVDDDEWEAVARDLEAHG